MTEMRFDGRTVIVTGAGRGVGRSYAHFFAGRGACVVVADIGGEIDGTGASSGPADDVVTEIKAAGGEATACLASVAEEDGAAAIVQTAIDAYGRVDVVVNNAGIADPGPFADEPLDRFRRMIDVHYLGSVYVTKAAWPHMVDAGYGRIVNTCSEAALGTVPNSVSYGGAKGAVLGLTRSLAIDAPRWGIRVNGVLPRAMTRLAAPAVRAKAFDVPEETLAANSTGDKFGPDLVSPAAAFLAHESCQLNGEMFVAGGGQVFRVALVVNEGIASETNLTPEFIADNLDALLDLSTGHAVEAVALRPVKPPLLRE